jgi:hypothetical protein
MLARMFDVVFGCSHRRYSFPRKVRGMRSGASALTGTYVACLDCGTEFAYDWDEMRVIDSESRSKHYTQSIVTKQAA